MVRLQFCGAARTVTGSQHLIEVNGQRILLACGMYQGKRAEAYERNRNFSLDPKSINAMVLSHAHIDHPGKAANSQFCQNTTFGSKADENIGENTNYSVCEHVDPLSRHVRVGVQTGPRPA